MIQMIKNLVVFSYYFIYVDLFLAIFTIVGFDFYALDATTRVAIWLAIDALFMVFLYLLYRKDIKTDFKDYKKNYKSYFKYVNVYLIGVILMGLTNLLIQKLTGSGLSGNEQSIRALLPKYPIYITFGAIIFAPFVEEMIFRKIIKNIVSNKYAFYFTKMFKKDTKKLTTYAFIIISGLVFGLIHISNFRDTNQILLGIPYMIMGLDFAYIYHKTNNIFTTMVFHAIHNTILLLIQFIFY